MKRSIFSMLVAVLCGTSGLMAQEESITILPKPSKIIKMGDPTLLTGTTPVYLDEKAALDQAYITEILTEIGLQPLFVSKEKKAKIVFKLNAVPANNNDEAYRLAVMTPDTKKRIVATADKRQGLLYALQTLRQLGEPQQGGISFPGCIITDAPAFPWRAYMQDESRHFQGMQTVKNLLDELARLKMNTFHWHLVDDQGWRIEIKKYPLLTEVGSKRDFSNQNLSSEEWDKLHSERSYYTQDEIREIVKYADVRGIKIVPEIEVPGHASASIMAYPWIGASSRREGKAVGGDLYDVSDPKVMEFLQDILDEVIRLFPSKIVHIGGDEANYTHWQNSEAVQAFMKENNIPTCSDLQVWAINRMSQYLAAKGCHMIGWNEITGDNIRGEAHVQASQSEKLAEGTIVQFWDGDISLVNKAIEKGYNVVNSNRFFTYLDYPYEVTPLEKAYSFNPIPEGLADEDKAKIWGTGCQMWGEFTPNLDRLYFQIFPRLAA
ncbi:MAG: beta-N-acetylhexosaminidase, partial [Alistipes sp.]|nr:beta-N-acetylhexosaminidase [Alistipes sp.]